MPRPSKVSVEKEFFKKDGAQPESLKENDPSSKKHHPSGKTDHLFFLTIKSQSSLELMELLVTAVGVFLRFFFFKGRSSHTCDSIRHLRN